MVKPIARKGAVTCILIFALLIASEVVVGQDSAQLSRVISEAKKLRQQAHISMKVGDYQAAITLMQRALSIAEQALGSDNPNLIPLLSDLVHLYGREGKYSLADSYLAQLLPLVNTQLKTLLMQGEARAYPVAVVLYNIAVQYRLRGDYSRAAALYRLSLRIRERLKGPESPAVAVALNGMGLLNLNIGAYQNAEPWFQRALAILEKALQLQISRRQLLGRPHGAGEEAQRSLNSYLIASLNGLATVAWAKGDLDKGASLFKHSLDIAEKSFDTESMTYAATLSSLAMLYKEQGRHADIDKMLRQSLSIREKRLGPLHPDVGTALSNLAGFYLSNGDTAQALQFASRSMQIGEHNLAMILALGSEEQKRLYMKTLGGQVDSVVTLHAHSAPDDAQALRLALSTVLRRKGRILDSMTSIIGTLRDRLSPQDRLLFNRLLRSRSQLAALILRSTESSDADQDVSALKSLNSEIHRLETELSAKYAEFRTQALPVAIESVQQAIPPDSALVEILSYRPLDTKAHAFKLERWQPARYIVYILRNEGTASWVSLGEAAAIDEDVKKLRAALRNPNSGKAGQPDLTERSRRLHEKIIRPILKHLGNTRRLFISSDGNLSLLPFGALMDDQGQYLVQSYSLTYLTSGSDLLRLQTQLQNKQEPVVIANPLFNQAGTNHSKLPQSTQTNNNNRRSREFQRRFDPLESTAQEALEVSKLLRVKPVTGGKATESIIKQTYSPRILHIATHGFFLPNQKPETSASSGQELATADAPFGSVAGLSENPLLRSGLALAGANQLQGGNGEDGILTALEASGLDLWGTKLVVLSACETGLGDVQNGEGVYGLRRALVLAGAESQVMSLWKVNDEVTRDLMVGYYRQLLLAGKGRGEALRQVQLDMIASKGRSNDLSHPYYWASFIQSGEWKNLDGKDTR